MPRLSKEQIAQFAAKAGFAGEDLRIAVAVALAESGGRTDAHNSTPPDDSYGLWQINMLGAMGPERRKRFNLKANTDLFDPATNARAAYAIFKGSGWKAWTTYTRGTYKKYMSDLPSAAALIPGPIGAIAIAQSIGEGDPQRAAESSPLLGVAESLNGLGKNLFDSVANVAGVIIAAVLVILGIVLLARNVIPVGKALKIAKKVAK